tara:strand:+ start:11111 stop:14068 length:2958 start_codon:yes stop_codon:yes gene_type:complete
MNSSTYFKQIIVSLFVLISNVCFAQYQSSILHYNEDDRLVYHSDKDGNRITDFSHVGYKNGEAALPIVPVVLQINPILGDNTAHIQAAINQVEAMPLDQNGHRGALLLGPGNYSVYGTLYVNRSGVTLRGSGDGENPATNTIIRGVGNTPNKRTLIVIGTNKRTGFGGRVSGTTQNITSEYIPVGSRTITVADASKYSVGNNIVIKHPSTAAWLSAVNYGDVAGDDPWNPGEIDMIFNRYITQIVGDKIKFDTPLYHELDKSLSQAFVYVYNGSSQISECGIENMRFFVETAGSSSDGNHVYDCVDMIGVRDSWAKNITALHMGDAGIKLEEATRCTVTNSKVLEPHGPISGGWRYNFYVGDNTTNILVKNCVSSKGRHAFVSNGASKANGIVFTECSSTGDYTRSESHRRWGQGMLWDNISWSATSSYGILGLHNRGNYGTGHGWSITNGVAWNIDAPNNQIAVQKPPIGQNYAIGCDATVDNDGPFPQSVGYIEGTGEHMEIQSLYAAQLNERLTYGVSPDAPGRLIPTNFVYNNQEKYLKLEWFDIALDETSYILERSSNGGATYQELATLPANTEVYTDNNLQQPNYFYRLKAINSIGFSAYSNLTESNDYGAPEKFETTFQVSLKEVIDFYENGKVWVYDVNNELQYTLEDLNDDGVFAATLSFEEGTEFVYRFKYQTGANPDSNFNKESISQSCGDGNSNRTFTATREQVNLPIFKFATCEQIAPTGTDITDIIGTIITGSNDDEPWINGANGAGSPPDKRVEKLIDNDISIKYVVRAITSWIEISSDQLSRVTGYTITSADDVPNRDPRDWELQGWDGNNNKWIVIHKVIGNPVWPSFATPKIWSFENDKLFKKYRLKIFDINNDHQGLMQMAELQIWGQTGEQLSKGEIDMANYNILNYPNPFSNKTTIAYNISTMDPVKIEVFDLFGKKITTLVDENKTTGKHHVEWNAGGHASGIYFYRISIGDFVATKKLILTK